MATDQDSEARMTRIRALLRRDPCWSVYALGDMDPRRAAFCEWHRHGDSVALLYREFDTPILFAAGAPDVMDCVPEVDQCLLQVPEPFLDKVRARFSLERSRRMRRMCLRHADFVWRGAAAPVEPLVTADEREIRELFADGRETGDEPDFFMPGQMHDGTFFGVRHNGRLVAAGGTHLYSAPESVGAIGNVYTDRAHRGRGLASAVTSAIVRLLIERGTSTIALNVKPGNVAAIRLYEQLGFRAHTHFLEGLATTGSARSLRR